MMIYTIGYGGRRSREFLEQLCQHGIRAVADVRLRPQGESMGCNTTVRSLEKRLQALLNQKGIGYFWQPELGNLFWELPDWEQRYSTLLRQPGELLTERLLSLPTPLCM